MCILYRSILENPKVIALSDTSFYYYFIFYVICNFIFPACGKSPGSSDGHESILNIYRTIKILLVINLLYFNDI